MGVQPVEALMEAVRRWGNGGSRILWWQKLCLWLSLVLPKSDYYGNLIALIFLAWCAVFPDFPFAEQIPYLGVRGLGWTDVHLCSTCCILGSDLDIVLEAWSINAPALTCGDLGRLPA